MAKLFLTQLNLAQFRCFSRLQLKTDHRSIILTGENGSGKTSILEAISLFSPGRGLRRAKVADLARHLSPSPSWKVSCQIDRDGTQRSVETTWMNSSKRRLEIDGKSVKQAELNDCLTILWLTPAMDRLWSESADGRRRFLDRTTMSLIADHAVDVMAYDRAMRERNRLLRLPDSDAHWLKALEFKMGEAGAKLTRQRLYAIERLTRALAGSVSPFPIGDIRLISQEGAQATTVDREELTEAFRLSRPRDFKAGRTLIGPHRADLVVEFQGQNRAAQLCSTGEQKALLISLILANARAILEDFDCPPVMLLDEIAAHLDMHRFQMFLAEAKQLDCQMWMTGTEWALFDSLAEEAQKFQMVVEPDGTTVKVIN